MTLIAPRKLPPLTDEQVRAGARPGETWAKVRRTAVDQARFAAMADQLQAENDNALDVRRAHRIPTITIGNEQGNKEIQWLTA
ncbi:TPA: hypothetical protein L4H97_006018 [Pseudomonas aeruginosa]|nr:hypothetical protein [Pseudomonas aeruginosa]